MATKGKATLKHMMRKVTPSRTPSRTRIGTGTGTKLQGPQGRPPPPPWTKPQKGRGGPMSMHDQIKKFGVPAPRPYPGARTKPGAKPPAPNAGRTVKAQPMPGFQVKGGDAMIGLPRQRLAVQKRRASMKGKR